MRIILFYDSFVRDYRGLLIVRELLLGLGHTVVLRVMWDHPKLLIDHWQPNVVKFQPFTSEVMSIIKSDRSGFEI